MLLAGDAVSGGVADLGPGAAGEHGLEDPLEVEGAVMEDAELDVGGDSGPRMGEDVEEVRGGGLDESPGHEAMDGLAFEELLESLLGIAVIGGIDQAGDIRPCPARKLRILGVHVDLRQLPAEDRLDLGLILGLEEFYGLDLVLGAEALSGACGDVLSVVGAVGAVGPTVEPISCLHGGCLLRVVQSSLTGFSHAEVPDWEQPASSRRVVSELGLAVPRHCRGGTLLGTLGPKRPLFDPSSKC